jgi:hypothetical protein
MDLTYEVAVLLEPPELDTSGNLFSQFLKGHIGFMPSVVGNNPSLCPGGIINDGAHAGGIWLVHLLIIVRDFSLQISIPISGQIIAFPS